MANALSDEPDDETQDFDQPRESHARAMTVVASRTPVTPQDAGAFVSGTVLAPGRPFDHHDHVAALVLRSGERIEAAPSMYFDTSPRGRTIRLWQRTVPGVDRDSRQLAWWWARQDVGEVLSQPELARRQEEERLGTRRAPRVISGIDLPQTPQRLGHTGLWQGLIVAILLAAIAVAWLLVFGVIPAPADPALTAEQLTALLGAGALLIFGVTCIAIVQKTPSR